MSRVLTLSPQGKLRDREGDESTSSGPTCHKPSGLQESGSILEAKRHSNGF